MALHVRYAALALAALVTSSVSDIRLADWQVQPPASTAVFAALLDRLVPGDAGDSLVVSDSTLVFTAPKGIPSMFRDYEKMPIGLVAALDSLSHPARHTSTLHLPRPVHLLGSTELASIFRDGYDGWNVFNRRFPKQRAILSFSPVAFSQDSLSAVVVVSRQCGYLCGAGTLLWMEQDGSGRWHVREGYQLWFS